MANSTKAKPKSKAHQDAKPYPEFPLTAHPSGRWCKKRKGTVYYFGKIEDGWEPALAQYEREWPMILKTGRRPAQAAEPAKSDGYTVADLCNDFLNAKLRKMQSGEIVPRTFEDCRKTCESIIAHFGRHPFVASLTPADFEKLRATLAKRHKSITNLKVQIVRHRGVFKFANKKPGIDLGYEDALEIPSAKTVRKARNRSRREDGLAMFEASEIRKILDACEGKEITLDENGPKTGEPMKVTPNPSVELQAMVLLGINAGFGNSDCAGLPANAIDFKSGWIDFPREKTAVERRVPLWPETLDALRVALAARPVARDTSDADLVFLTHHGRPWVRTKTKWDEKRQTERSIPIDSLSQKFARLMKRLKVNGRRGLGFYSLRHTFQTVGGDAKDPEAVSAIMGHVDSSMGAVYRERISAERLQAVVNVVRGWLFDDAAGE